jgi:hypothetical protein
MMSNVRIRVPGEAGKIEARAERLRRAVVDEMERVTQSKAKQTKAKPLRSELGEKDAGRLG